MWAEAEWFTSKINIQEALKVIVFKVDGETNTDDLSPAQEAWSRADIPLHARSMFLNKIPNIFKIIDELKLIFVSGDTELIWLESLFCFMYILLTDFK